MKPVVFTEQNAVLKAPPGQEEECGELPTWWGDGQFISCWELDPSELKEVLETGRVWLRVFSKHHPPVYLSTERPFVTQELANVEEAPELVN